MSHGLTEWSQCSDERTRALEATILRDALTRAQGMTTAGDSVALGYGVRWALWERDPDVSDLIVGTVLADVCQILDHAGWAHDRDGAIEKAIEAIDQFLEMVGA